MKTLIITPVIFLVLSLVAVAQVDEIKSESSKHSNEKSTGSVTSSSDSDNNSFGAAMFAGLMRVTFGGVAIWQVHRLEKKPMDPSIVSFDLMLQGAIQPSTYYILQPRIRGTWGLFSTDYRSNYLIEESIEGTKHIRTDDWQILQLNILNTPNFTGRFGGGILHENFSGNKTFAEWTVGAILQNNSQKFGGMLEYRWSEPRLEASAQIHFNVFSGRSVNTYLTTGGVFQRYYDKVNVWGIQAGIMFRIAKWTASEVDY